ncbi:MAG: prepilin-type N-terminal cleavage/methylation domain-containing protein [Betaproteobacteria bacterium]|jgi:prepilin-type N-terminal cleavage/methylation domain-containing protein|nr:prepilin-type N-terminal cleavage/methylation domain-containing protein [Betaproteobacteria bacterium]
MTRSRFWRRNAAARAGARARGFTLTELAITVTIVALLIGGIALTLTAQNEARQFSETQARLAVAQEALVGFAIRNGRLPCPAAPTGALAAFRDGTAVSVAGTGEEAFAAGGTSANGNCWQFHGLLPAMSLGISTTNPQGYLLDAWDTPIRYSVTSWNTNTFTKNSGIAGIGVTGLLPDLQICSAAGCGQVLTAAGTVPAVILAVGKNRKLVAHDVDEAENYDNDLTFVSHEPRPTGAAGGDFDDLVTWLSVNVLVNRMVAAGAL